MTPAGDVMTYAEDPIVSGNITGDPAPAMFDAALTRVSGRHVRVAAWYDDEWASPTGSWTCWG